jgi:acyl-CoA hydrolase
MTRQDAQQYPDSEIKTIETVFPSMINTYGTMFGGIAMQWMDRSAWICSTRYTRKQMVTIASNRIEFKKPIPQGNLVELKAVVIRVGRTSLTIRVDLYSEAPLSGKCELATTGEFVMVAVDQDGRPIPVSE